MYYGHSPDGYSNRNCFFFQTRSVLSVFDALNENQRRQAVVVGTPRRRWRRRCSSVPPARLTPASPAAT